MSDSTRRHHFALRANGTPQPFITYDRLGELDHGVIVDNKRLGRALEMIKLVQDKRDKTRSQPCHPLMTDLPPKETAREEITKEPERRRHAGSNQTSANLEQRNLRQELNINLHADISI